MKKIICFALVLLMLFGMSSCFLKKDDTIEIGGVSEASKVTSIVTYVDDNGTLTSQYVTEIDRTNELAIFSYVIQSYAPFELGSDARVVTETGAIHYNMAAMEMTADGGKNWFTTDDDVDAGLNLKLQREQFKTYEPFDDGYSAVATLDPAQAKSVLGTEVETKDGSDITVTIVSNGTFVYNIGFEYIAVSGARVIVETTYNYEKITLDFSGLEGVI